MDSLVFNFYVQIRKDIVVITLSEALRIISNHLVKVEQSIGEPLSVMAAMTLEKPFGWVFFYNTKKYIDTGDFKYMLGGNAPFIVDRDSGEIHETGTAHPIEYYIKKYEQENGGECSF